MRMKLIKLYERTIFMRVKEKGRKRVVDSDCCIINFTRRCFFAEPRRGYVVSTESLASASFCFRLMRI